jgi:hypothetical protein
MLEKLNCHVIKVSIFVITAALIVGMAGCDGDGYTPPSQNLEIRTWYDLDDVRDNLAGHHTLMNDLNSTTPGYEELASPTANGGKGWQPIGIWFHGLSGSFDGQGYEIRDLFVNRPDEECIGLFGEVSRGGNIENVGVVNATVTGGDGVGGLVVGNDGTVSSSCFIGNVTGNRGVGGLVGASTGYVRNSYSVGNVIGATSNVGGLMGTNYDGFVYNSYSTCNVTGTNLTGGLVGEHVYGTVTNSYATGHVVAGDEGVDVGGLVGRNFGGTVSNSFWDTETSGQSISGGGAGKNTTEMKDIATFSGAGWNIIAVALNETNPSYIWNIVNNETYPFLSWEPV